MKDNKAKFDNVTIAAFVLSVLCFFFGGLYIFNVLAIIFSLVGIYNTNRLHMRGLWMAITALILSIISTAVWLI